MTHSPPTSPKILFIDGSLGGTSGNSYALSRAFIETLPSGTQTSELVLRENPTADTIIAAISDADGFVFLTGTYWDSWGSPLQKFLEDFTHLEGTPAYLGKPAAVLVTMHSVGGKEVLSRLQGVLNTLGLSIPPMSGIAYSYASQLALETDAGKKEPDFWSRDDLGRIAHHLMIATEQNRSGPADWQAWTIDRRDPRKKWIR